MNKFELVINHLQEISDDKIHEFESGLEKIRNNVPIQYITNRQEFMKLDFYVDENVLIPQPDTEVLVEEVIKYTKQISRSLQLDICSTNNIDNASNSSIIDNLDNADNVNNAKNVDNVDNANNVNCSNDIRRNSNYIKNGACSKLKILDLCTGSGAVAISLAKYIENCEVTAIDISSKAIEVAKLNAKKNMVDKKINFIESDMFEMVPVTEFDIIVSNPPYIETDAIATLDKEVQNEPRIALDGGIDGLDFYRNIIKNAESYLCKNGKLFMEIGYNQKQKLFNLVHEFGYYDEPVCVKDLGGNDRVIILQYMQ